MSIDLLSLVVGIDEVAEIVRGRLTELGRSQGWLGAEIAGIMGREQPFVQTAVSQWLRGTTDPEPPVVFAMERALSLRPGDLSRHLGYLPIGARPTPMTVRGAIDADARLTPKLKRALTLAYNEMVRKD